MFNRRLMTMNLSEHVRVFLCVLNYFKFLGLVSFTEPLRTADMQVSSKCLLKEKINIVLSYLRKRKQSKQRKNPVRKFGQNFVIILSFLGAAESWMTQNQR